MTAADGLVPSQAVLVVIDVQNDFCDSAGTMAAAGLDVSAAGRAVDALQHVLVGARRAGVPIIFVRTEHDDEVDSVAWRRRLAGTRRLRGQEPEVNCRSGSWGADFFVLTPAEQETVIVKHRYSAFSTPEFEQALTSLGRPSVLFAGVATHICVESTLRDAVDRDYVVSVIADCCAAYDERDHTSAVQRINDGFGPAVESARLLDEWRTNATTATGGGSWNQH